MKIKRKVVSKKDALVILTQEKKSKSNNVGDARYVGKIGITTGQLHCGSNVTENRVLVCNLLSTAGNIDNLSTGATPRLCTNGISIRELDPTIRLGCNTSLGSNVVDDHWVLRDQYLYIPQTD